MKTLVPTLAAGLTLAMSALVMAQGGSLNDARMGVIKGTAPGIVIFDFARRPQAPSAAASAASAAGGANPATAQKRDAADARPASEGLGSMLKWGEPPSGRPLNAARRLDSPSLGIPLPTGGAASQPAGSGQPKPGG
ncbi:MAG: hypothetical protein V4792_13750 [Pseudomonadota bacterium]